MEIPYLDPPKPGCPAPPMNHLEQVAIAAGHGHTHRGLIRPSPWYDLEDNCRPSYDMHFVQTFNPDFVLYLLKRLQAAEARNQ